MTKEHREDLIKPGNEDYLSHYNYQGEWKPTKAVGAIGAMSSSPGPAIVYLPPSIGEENHDPRKVKAPGYKIGLKDSRQTFSCGPGPAKYDIRKFTNKGKDECHAPKVGDKIEGHVHFRSPGPLAYHRSDSDNYVYPRMPAYTMRPKPDPLMLFSTPAPAAYILPEMLGPGRSPYRKSPAYSIAERLDKTGLQQPNPGPLDYVLPSTNVNKPRSPAFSIRLKDDQPAKILSPDPGSNECHAVKFHKPSTPRFTFGIKHTPFKAFQHFAAEN